MAPYPSLPSLAELKQLLVDEFPGLATCEGFFAHPGMFVVLCIIFIFVFTESV